MSAEEEVEEHVHHAKSGFDKLVAGSMAIIAALLAVVSVLGQHFNTEKLLTQQKASDQWAYYQAKDIRRYTAQIASDLLTQGKSDVQQKYAQDSARYKQQTAEIQDKAHELERETEKMGHQADSFHFGEVFLELAIVLSSLAILTKRQMLFYGGLSCALFGVLIAASGYFWYSLPAHG
jgi:hypothetical protein